MVTQTRNRAIDKDLIIQQLVKRLVDLQNTSCSNCGNANVYTGELDLCAGGDGVHVRLHE